MTYISVILITGGVCGSGCISSTVELIRSDGSQICSLPDLPSRSRHHTQNGLTSCGGYDSPARFSCYTLSSSGSWVKSHSLPGVQGEPGSQGRRFHSAWASPQGIILLGGNEEKTTTEIITDCGNTTSGFTLDYDTM